MANAIAGVGTTFERWSGSAWQFIAEINAIEGPTMDKENIEVTALDTDGGYDEFITGFMEGGTLTLNMNFSRSGYELMKQDFEIDVARDYRITLPDDEDTTLEFEGLVIEIPLTMEAEDKLTADVTIQVTGEVAIASAGEDSSVAAESESSSDIASILADGHTLAWYVADDESTVTDSSGQVSVWADKLGSGRDLKQATEAYQPALQSDGTIGLGPGKSMKCDAFIWNQPAYVFLLFKQRSWSAGDYIFTNGSGPTVYLNQNPTAEPSLRGSAGTSGTVASAAGGITVGNWHIFIILFSGANSKSRTDNPTLGFDINLGTNNPGGFGIGGVSQFYCADVEFQEIILRDSGDSLAEIYAYLDTRRP